MERDFIGCALDPNCVIETVLQVILINIWRWLRKELNMDRNNQFCITATVVVMVMEAIEAQECLIARGSGLTAFHVRLEEVACSLFNAEDLQPKPYVK